MWEGLRKWWAKEPYLRPSLRSDMVARSLVPLSDEELCNLLKRSGATQFYFPKHIWFFDVDTTSQILLGLGSMLLVGLWPIFRPYCLARFGPQGQDSLIVIEFLVWTLLTAYIIVRTAYNSGSMYSRRSLLTVLGERIADLSAQSLPAWKTISDESHRIATDTKYQQVRLKELIAVPKDQRDRTTRLEIVQRRCAVKELQKQRAELTSETQELINMEQEVKVQLQAVRFQIELPSSEKVLGKAKFTASEVEARIANESGLDAKLIAETTARLNQFAERIAAREVARVEVE